MFVNIALVCDSSDGFDWIKSDPPLMLKDVHTQTNITAALEVQKGV